jgi:hypothetical protein
VGQGGLKPGLRSLENMEYELKLLLYEDDNIGGVQEPVEGYA